MIKNTEYTKLAKKAEQRIRPLKSTHGRKKEGAFLVEGIKNVTELLISKMDIDLIYLSDSLSDNQQVYFQKLCFEKNIQLCSLRDQDYNKISTMKNPEGILAVCRYPEQNDLSALRLPALFLSEVNDPGNLGTIFRTAAWYGIKSIILSENSVDAYNPKVLRGSMGSFMHLTILQQISYKSFINFTGVRKISVFAADLKGENPAQLKPQNDNYILAFGSESHGVPEEIKDNCKSLLSIPKFGKGESLNLAVSVGIILNSIINRGNK